MLWLSTSPCSERTQDGDFTIRWVGIGFGWWRIQAYCRDTLICEWMGSEYEALMNMARDRCYLHKSGWAA